MDRISLAMTDCGDVTSGGGGAISGAAGFAGGGGSSILRSSPATGVSYIITATSTNSGDGFCSISYTAATGRARARRGNVRAQAITRARLQEM